MVSKSIYQPEPEHLAKLSPDEAVEVFRDLLLAEAWREGISKADVDVPGAIHAKDGGIDAEVISSAGASAHGLIQPGLTRYQIKSSTGTKGKKKIVRHILFEKDGKTLKPRVKGCLDQGGTLVVVLFEDDIPDPEEDELAELIRTNLQKQYAEYESASIRILRQNKIISAISSYPGLALRVRGVPVEFETHLSWSLHDGMKKQFVKNEAQEKRIQEAQGALLQRETASHVRITGEAGVGKTRLALEITRHPEIGPTVCYFDSGESCLDGLFLKSLLMDDTNATAVLVVDECRDYEARKLWDKIKNRGKRIALITIYNESESGSGTTNRIVSPPLASDKLAAIIAEYTGDPDGAGRWAEFCGGSPRVAHVIGWNLAEHPEDLLASPDTVKVWDRFVAGGDDPGSPEVTERSRVLRHFALFRRFGFTSADADERDAVVAVLRDSDSSLTPTRIDEIVKMLKDHKILQGSSMLYITPKAFHVWLWTQWWEHGGTQNRFMDIVANAPPTLKDSALEMLRYAQESELAVKTVGSLLGEDGPLQELASLGSELGGRLFRYLTEADPDRAIETLQRLLEGRTVEELKVFRAGRRDVVEALRIIAMERHLFVDAASVLLTLAEAENESWSNNATGIFASLFSPAPHPRVSPTAASPLERLPVLEEGLESESRARRLISIKACNAGLESRHFMRDVGPEYRGLRPERLGWSPASNAEWISSLKAVWELLTRSLDWLQGEEASEASKVLSHHARGLVEFPDLRDMVFDTMKNLGKHRGAETEAVIEGLAAIVQYERDSLTKEEIERFKRLRDSIPGTDFRSRLRRFVAMQVFHDHFDDEGNRVDQAEMNIKSLAAEAIANPGALESEFPWLVTISGKNAYRFGYELGSKDKGWEFYNKIVRAVEKSEAEKSGRLLAGYLRAVAEIDLDEFHPRIESLSKNDQFESVMASVIGSSMVTGNTGRILLELAQRGKIEPVDLNIANLGDLPEDVFGQWIDYLLEQDGVGPAATALDLASAYYDKRFARGNPPKDLLWRILTNKNLVDESDSYPFGTMDEYHWKKLAERFIDIYPERQLSLADWVVGHLGEKGPLATGFRSDVHLVLNAIAVKDPSGMWRILSGHLEDFQGRKSFMIGHWLQSDRHGRKGMEPAFLIFPEHEVLEWIDENSEERAPFVARHCPLGVLSGEGDSTLAKTVLSRYGRIERVGREMSANLYSGGGFGRPSERERKLVGELKELEKVEEDPNVLKWLRREIKGSKERIDDWIRFEERVMG